jgi:hypothetical protein
MDARMDELSESDLHALHILAEKKAGNAVPFINIAAARRLTELGLASRSHEGWDITPEGGAVLARRSPPPA